MSDHENHLEPTQLLRITKALADPQRFAILQRIASQPEVACKELVAEFSITQATISHHLKELCAVDLIHSRRVGQCAMLSRREDVLADYLDQMQQRLLPIVSQHTGVNRELPDECR